MIRRAPRPSTNWTMIRNEVIADPELSFKATGVLIYILSKPDHWHTSTAHLATVKREGLDAIRTALAELRLAGYVRTRRYQDDRGRWQYDTEVFDTRQPVGKPVGTVDSCPPPQRDYPRGENGPVLVKTERTKTHRKSASNQIQRIRLCGNCSGQGKVIEDSYIVTCSTCNGDGIG
ncbi:MAG: hypothetical protein EB132_02400 [Actinobacteria bacterium]|nr:hypothetical protein [Actinomycetota bacterium]